MRKSTHANQAYKRLTYKPKCQRLFVGHGRGAGLSYRTPPCSCSAQASLPSCRISSSAQELEREQRGPLALKVFLLRAPQGWMTPPFLHPSALEGLSCPGRCCLISAMGSHADPCVPLVIFRLLHYFLRHVSPLMGLLAWTTAFWHLADCTCALLYQPPSGLSHSRASIWAVHSDPLGHRLQPLHLSRSSLRSAVCFYGRWISANYFGPEQGFCHLTKASGTCSSGFIALDMHISKNVLLKTAIGPLDLARNCHKLE